MFSILITFSCGLSDSGKPLSDTAARFAEVFPPSNTPLSLALQNKEEVFDLEGGKPSLITLLNFDSPPTTWKHHKESDVFNGWYPLSKFATAA